MVKKDIILGICFFLVLGLIGLIIHLRENNCAKKFQKLYPDIKYEQEVHGIIIDYNIAGCPGSRHLHGESLVILDDSAHYCLFTSINSYKKYQLYIEDLLCVGCKVDKDANSEILRVTMPTDTSGFVYEFELMGEGKKPLSSP